VLPEKFKKELGVRDFVLKGNRIRIKKKQVSVKSQLLNGLIT